MPNNNVIAAEIAAKMELAKITCRNNPDYDERMPKVTALIAYRARRKRINIMEATITLLQLDNYSEDTIMWILGGCSELIEAGVR